MSAHVAIVRAALLAANEDVYGPDGNQDALAALDRLAADTERLLPVAREAADELASALARFAPFNSPHEGKAVIEEELDELWQHVKENTGRSAEARKEAIQIAAMAMRYVLDLCDAAPGSPPAGTEQP